MNRETAAKVRSGLQESISGLRLALPNRRSLLTASGVALFLAVLYLVLIPVAVIPGNDIPFQLGLIQPLDILQLGLLSALTGVLIALDVHFLVARRRARAQRQGAATGATGTGILSGVIASGSCPACMTAVFGFLGTPAALFLVANRWWFTAAGMVILTLSILLVSRAVAHCGVPPRSK